MSTRKLGEGAYFVVDESSFLVTISAYDPLVANQGIAVGTREEWLMPFEPAPTLDKPFGEIPNQEPEEGGG